MSNIQILWLLALQVDFCNTVKECCKTSDFKAIPGISCYLILIWCLAVCPSNMCPDDTETCVKNGSGWKCVCSTGFKFGKKVCESKSSLMSVFTCKGVSSV